MTDIHIDHPKCIRKALWINWFLIIYNIGEAVASIVFGILAKSVALVGFGLDSVIEAAAAGVLIWRLSIHSDDEKEEEGERKALFFVGITFFLLAAYVAYESLSSLLKHEAPHESLPGIIIAVLSILIMPTFGFAKKKIAKQIGSKALEADAMGTIICSYLSGILLIGLALNLICGWWWADPVAGLIMVVFIIKEGWEAVEECRGGKSCCSK